MAVSGSRRGFFVCGVSTCDTADRNRTVLGMAVQVDDERAHVVVGAGVQGRDEQRLGPEVRLRAGVS